MTQWGGILGPQPPQDSLTGDTNSHTNTLSHGVCNCICILQVPKLSTVHLFSFHWPSFCLSIDMSIRLLWKPHSFHVGVHLWSFMLMSQRLHWHLNLNFSHFVFMSSVNPPLLYCDFVVQSFYFSLSSGIHHLSNVLHSPCLCSSVTFK